MTDAFLGEIQLFGFDFAPVDWAFCNGAVIPLQQNPALFSLLGVRYGGNGTSTFQLPNFTGRTACNQGNGTGLTPRSAGDAFGEIGVTLTTPEMPAHSHAFTVYNQPDQSKRATTPFAGAALTVPTLSFPFTNTAQPDAQFAQSAIGVAGSNMAHENRQPYLALNYCIALRGEFPQFD